MKNDPFNSKRDWNALRLKCWRCLNAVLGHLNRFKPRRRYIGLRMLNMEHPGWRKRGTLRRSMDVLEEDMQQVGVTEDRRRCRWSDSRDTWCFGGFMSVYLAKSCFGSLVRASLRSLNFMLCLFLFSKRSLVVIYLVLQMWFHFWLSSRCVQMFESLWFPKEAVWWQRCVFTGLSCHETFGSLLEFEP